VAPPDNVGGNGINLRDIRKTHSTVFKPTAFLPAKDMESNNAFQIPSERDYDYGDQEHYQYKVQQSAAKGVTPVKIDVEQVVELVGDQSAGAEKRRSSHGMATRNG